MTPKDTSSFSLESGARSGATSNARHMLVLVGAVLAIMTPGAAQAYTGPGIGLGALGVALGLIGSLLLGLISLVWYPLKRLIRRLRNGQPDRSAQ